MNFCPYIRGIDFNIEFKPELPEVIESDEWLTSNGSNEINVKKTSIRLTPVNKAAEDSVPFNNISFIIFCAKHRKIAVCETIQRGYPFLKLISVNKKRIGLWLPFVYLSFKSTYKVNRTIRDSLSLILSDNDSIELSDLFVKYREELPFYYSVIDISKIYSRKNSWFISRVICFARLHSDGPVLQCCRKTSRIHWISVEEVSNGLIDCFWGPEVKMYCDLIKHDMSVPDSIPVMNRTRPHLFSTGQIISLIPEKLYSDPILKSLKITGIKIQALFEDFIEHCFPSYYMSFHSFKDYFIKYYYRRNEKFLRKVFNALSYEKPGFVTFEQLLNGLAYIDPSSPNDENRIKFVFRYYDTDRDGYLTEDELRALVEDIHANDFQGMVETIITHNLQTLDEPSKGMTFSEFYDRVSSHQLEGTFYLCRTDVQWFQRIVTYLMKGKLIAENKRHSFFDYFRKFKL